MYLYIYSLDQQKNFIEFFPKKIESNYILSEYMSPYIYKININLNAYLGDSVNNESLNKIELLLDNCNIKDIIEIASFAILIGPFNADKEVLEKEFISKGFTIVEKDKYSYHILKTDSLYNFLKSSLTISRKFCYEEPQKVYSPDIPFKVSNAWPISEIYREFPATAFDMFKEQGITEILSETIPIGHKVKMTFFSSIKVAKMFNKIKKYHIEDETGKRFFKDRKLEHLIYKDIYCKLTSDVCVLETIVLPFSLSEDILKYEKYIDICYSNRSTQDSPLIYNIDSFNDYFKEIKKQNKLTIVMLDILKVGNLINDSIVWEDNTYLTNLEKYSVLKYFASDLFKVVPHNYVNLEDRSSMEDELFHWSKVCIKNKGVLYRPIEKDKQTLMVHSYEYLKFIYGIDYLEKDFF